MTLQGIVPEVEAYLGVWKDITPEGQFGILIDRGYGADSTGLRPGTCNITLLDPDFKYARRNPLSPNYGLLTGYNRLRVARRLHQDGFEGRTVSSGWGTSSAADGADVWSTAIYGSGLASDFAVAAGKGTHLVSAAGGGRLSYLGGVSYRNIEVAGTVTIPVSDVTGASLGAEIWFRGQAAGAWIVRVWVTTAELVTIAFYGPQAGPSNLIASTTLAGVTHTAAQPLRYRAQIEGMALRASVWQPGLSDEPKTWHLTGSDTQTPPSTHTGIGWVGVASWADTSNTNVPVTISHDDIVIRSVRATAEVGSWPVRWDTGGGDPFTRIEAAGVQRRLGKGSAQERSLLYRAITTQSNAPVAYWSCEDGKNATTMASGVVGAAPMAISGTPTLASHTGFVASSALPLVSNSTWSGLVPAYTATGQIQFRYLMQVPTGGGTDGMQLMLFETTGTAGRWGIYWRTGGSLQLIADDNNGAQIFDSGGLGFAVNGKLLRVSLELNQNGTTLEWLLSILEVGATMGGFFNSTLASRTVGAATRVAVNQFSLVNDVAIGHISVQKAIDSLFTLSSELNAYTNETTGARIGRTCGEAGVPFSTWPGWNATGMGAQLPAAPMTVIAEAVDTNAGLLVEPCGDVGLEFRPRSALDNQAAGLALDYAAGHISPSQPPLDDDQRVRNDITVNRTNGSSVRATVTTGPNSISRIGRVIGDPLTLNLSSDTQLPQHAAWRVHVAAADAPRFPEIKVNLARPETAGKLGEALGVQPGDRITIDNASAWGTYDQISQLAIGYAEELDSVQHILTFRTLPEVPHQILILDDATRSGIDTTSVLAEGYTDSATPLSVATTSGPLWTTDGARLPVDLGVAGERMTLTAVANEVFTFVAAGTAAHADNAAVTPGLPAGLQAGDLIIGVAAIRNTAATVAGATGGYDWMDTNFTDFRLFWKTCGNPGSEVAPQVNFAGGSAGDTTSAFLFALRGKTYNPANLIVDRAYLTNTSAQNIAYPALNLRVPNAVVLVFGKKADDWTSVATLGGGFTEIAEPSSTTGSDQGLVADYLIQTSPADVAGGSFTVTGGASAVSKSIAIVLRSDRQAFTVTRNVNNAAKAQAAGTPVELFSRHALGF